MISKARAGIYTQFEVQRGLPIQLLVKHFKQFGDKWQIAPEIRKMATFREYNLLHDLAPLGQFDVVFCRNVLIYFDQPTKTQVLERVARLLPADGLLVLGGAETIIGITERLRPVDNHRGLFGLASSAAAGLRQAAGV